MLLPIVVALGALILAVSEFMTAFEFTPPGAEPLDSVSSADRHSYAMLVLAVFVLVALLIAVATGSRPAAYAVAAAGVIALLVFLIFDLPDAGRSGLLPDLLTARAEPQAGFWLEAVGAVTIGLGGIALATLSSEQLQTLPAKLRRRPGAPKGRPAR